MGLDKGPRPGSSGQRAGTPEGLSDPKALETQTTQVEPAPKVTPQTVGSGHGAHRPDDVDGVPRKKGAAAQQYQQSLREASERKFLDEALASARAFKLVIPGLMAAGVVIGIATAGGGATSATTPPPAPIVAATNAPSAPAAGAAFDPCALVTAQEAATVFGKPATTSSGPAPSAECTYTPASSVVFSFPEGTHTAQLRLDTVVITVATGTDATTRYDARQSIFGKDRDDQAISALGDKAIVVSDQLSVLQGSKYVNVSTQSEREWGDGNRRYEDVHQKYLDILTSFARPALGRMPERISASAAPRPGTSRAPVAAPTTTEAARIDFVGRAIIGGLAGLTAGLVAALGIAVFRVSQAAGSSVGKRPEG